MINQYEDQISGLSTDEIIKILEEDASNYRTDYLQAAVQELERRKSEGLTDNDIEMVTQEFANRNNNMFKLILSEKETIVKTYHCTTLQKPAGEGYLTVTNKRVVFHGHGESGGGKSKLVSEVPIEQVSGINVYYGNGTKTNFIIFSFIASILFLIFFCLRIINNVSESSQKNIFVLFAIVFFLLAVVLILFSKKTFYNFCIYSSGANGSPINIGDVGFGSNVSGQGAAFSVIAEPTLETEKMMDEIGAIILDLKALGDYAIEKWSDNKKGQSNNKSNYESLKSR